MLQIASLGGIKKIYWKDIEPGQIILGGINVNKGLPLELIQFPSLTVSLLFELNQKYHFLPNKEVIVAYPAKGESSIKLSKSIQELETRIKKFHGFRFAYLKKKLEILEKFHLPISEEFDFWKSDFIEKNTFQKGRLNSVKPRSGKIPSFLNRLRTVVSPRDVFSGELSKKLDLPENKNLQLFLGIAYSVNFKSEMVPSITEILNFFHEHLLYLLPGIKFHLLGFSETCEKIKFPIGGRELPNSRVSYSSFFKKCMHLKNKDITNKAILLTADSPVDLAETMEIGEKLKKNDIDLSIVYYTENLTEDEKTKMIHVRESSNCNLFITNSKEFLFPIFWEAFNHYYGNLVLSTKKIETPAFLEFQTPAINKKEEPKEENKPKEKVIKPFEFKKIKRDFQK